MAAALHYGKQKISIGQAVLRYAKGRGFKPNFSINLSENWV
jgi:hypothetical protein